VEFPDDAELVEVLRAFGLGPDDYLGHGGEAWVYALGPDRVLRVLHQGGRADDVRTRDALVAELRGGMTGLSLPELLEVGERAGRVYAIERRLQGRSVLSALAHVDGATRTQLIEAHLDAAAILGDLSLERRGYFGDLIDPQPIRCATWHEYLDARSTRNLAGSVPPFTALQSEDFASGLPEPDVGRFVHLDAFAGNMLTDGATITAVLDIGVTSVVGDRRLDPVASAAYLLSMDISPTRRDSDDDIVLGWLRNRGLIDLLEPARRWLAAFWTFAIDDPRVLRWCTEVLG